MLRSSSTTSTRIGGRSAFSPFVRTDLRGEGARQSDRLRSRPRCSFHHKSGVAELMPDARPRGHVVRHCEMHGGTCCEIAFRNHRKPRTTTLDTVMGPAARALLDTTA